MEIVAGAVKIGRHRRYEIASVLATVGLTKLDASDFGDGIGFVGPLQGSRQQRRFGDRLGSVARINARRAEKQKFFDTRAAVGFFLRVARRPYRFRRNLTSAIDECTKKTIQATSSTNMTPIIIRGHTRWNRCSRGIAAGLTVAVALTLGSEVVGPRLGSGG